MKIQRIRWCTQCQDLLPLKCERCTCDPKRRGKVLEVYDLPPILATAPCGCVKIACEVPDAHRPVTCAKTVWRSLHKVKRAEARFCSKKCSNLTLGLSRVLAQKVKCSTCQKEVVRTLAVLRRYRHAFCSQLCRKLNFVKVREEKKRLKIAQRVLDKVAKKKIVYEKDDQILCCYGPKHNGRTTVHHFVGGQIFACTEDGCTKQRSASITSSLSARR